MTLYVEQPLALLLITFSNNAVYRTAPARQGLLITQFGGGVILGTRL